MESTKELCRSCRQGEGIVPSVEEATGEQVWLCEHCFNEMFGTWVFMDRLVKEIDTQIVHHKNESNDGAIRSLQYIKDFVLNFKNGGDVA